VRLAEVMAHQLAIHPSAWPLFVVAPDLPVRVPSMTSGSASADWLRIVQAVTLNALDRS